MFSFYDSPSLNENTEVRYFIKFPELLHFMITCLLFQ
uniref:Uncharacterized protein n=1 Tax=Anguilla anguilla TaxID=7936 RepID=A0A0E9U1S5_ANGAN